MDYNHKNIEPKWQKYWDENDVFKTEDFIDKPKYYILDMFPYPSGSGLHVGHPLGYIATDILARYKRHQGYNVLHPMGWDAFGLPAEQYAIKTGTHPSKTTKDNVANFKRQIKMLGFSYDWSREINTTDPEYVKWTQWIFVQLYKKGLAYEAEVPVNWCREKSQSRNLYCTVFSPFSLSINHFAIFSLAVEISNPFKKSLLINNPSPV